MSLILRDLNSTKKIILWIILISLGIGISYSVVLQQYWVLAIPFGILTVVAAFLYTENTLLLAGAIAPLSVNFQDLGNGFGMSLPTEPIYIFLFGLLIFHSIKEGTFIGDAWKHPLIIIVGIYIFWLWFSSLFSTMPMVSAKFALARTWYITLFFYFGVRIFSNYEKIHFFMKWFVFFTLVVATYTLYMHSQDGFSRAASYGISWPFFPDHGMYAAALAYGVFSLLIYTFYVRQFNISLPWAPILFLLFAWLMFAIVNSYTRATWLSLIVAIGAWVITKFRIKFIWIIIAFFIALGAGYLKQDDIQYALEANKQGSSDELEGHVKSVSNISTDPSNLERINRWKCAARMVKEKPIFGFGAGTYVFQYAPFQKSSELTIISTNAGDLGDAHSEYFSAMSEMGFPGLIIWLSFVFITIGVAFRIIYTTDNLKIKLTTYMALLGLIAYHAHGVLNNYSQYDKLAVPLWAFTAIIVALDRRNSMLLTDAKSKEK